MEIEQLVSIQHEFFQTGKTLSIETRKRALGRLYRVIKENEQAISDALYVDLGKSSTEAYLSEIGFVLEEIRYAIKKLDSWTKAKKKKTSLAQFPGECKEMSEPYGVVLIIAPWNYPIMLNFAPLVGAIAAGNCVVLKPSEIAPRTSHLMAEMIKEIYPPFYITVVEGEKKENLALLSQKFDYIFYTGGAKVGQIVLEEAAKHLTPVTLELGGKSPCIIEKSANLKLAAKRVIFGKLLNSGQTCVAPDYLLVDETIKDQFVEYLIYWIHKMLGKKPLENPHYGHMVNTTHFHRVMNYIKGEKVLEGGYGDVKTLKIAPTILDEITLESTVMQEEIFGPILPIITFSNITEAKNIVLSREKPLALYLFTKNKPLAEYMMKTIPFGGGCINDTVIHLATQHMGFGGVGASGMGKYHGKYSFDTFSHTKGILFQSRYIDIPLRYLPYGKLQEMVVKKVLK